ncbi:unnamed protein product [Caenorhabditis nigoni]
MRNSQNSRNRLHPPNYKGSDKTSQKMRNGSRMENGSKMDSKSNDWIQNEIDRHKLIIRNQFKRHRKSLNPSYNRIS